MRVADVKDLKAKVFLSSAANARNLKNIPKVDFESDLLDNTSLDQKAVENICELWDYRHTSEYDIEELQASYQVYCKYCNYAEGKVRSIFEKLQAFFELTEENEEKKEAIDNDSENDNSEADRHRKIALMWGKDKELKEGFNLIIDLFRGGKDQDSPLNMKEFLEFIREPPFVNNDHISLIGMQHEILTKRVMEDMEKDFAEGAARDLIKAGEREDYLFDPAESYIFKEVCNNHGYMICMWEALLCFATITAFNSYHLCKPSEILS